MTRYSPDQLPIPVTEMALHRKTALTPMFGPITGPCVIETQEGDYELPDGWRGMLAIDKAGYPYPIALAEYHETYEPVRRSLVLPIQLDHLMPRPHQHDEHPVLGDADAPIAKPSR